MDSQFRWSLFNLIQIRTRVVSLLLVTEKILIKPQRDEYVNK